MSPATNNSSFLKEFSLAWEYIFVSVLSKASRFSLFSTRTCWFWKENLRKTITRQSLFFDLLLAGNFILQCKILLSKNRYTAIRLDTRPVCFESPWLVFSWRETIIHWILKLIPNEIKISKFSTETVLDWRSKFGISVERAWIFLFNFVPLRNVSKHIPQW